MRYNECMLILIAECQGRTLQFPLSQEVQKLTIGSLPENEISLPYRGVSRHHFALSRGKGGWTLKDLGSTNGTRVNGATVSEKAIKPGDVIQAGTVVLRVQNTPEERVIHITHAEPSQGDPYTTDEIVTGSWLGEGQSLPGLQMPEGMIAGKSSVMNQLYQRLYSLRDSDVSVLLIGETGTGKELFAKTLQASGRRANGPFVIVNCAAIPSELLEAELFGIGEKVATDVSQRKGKIAMADKGTLFLDELGAFPHGLQAKILRAIEGKCVTPVGQHTSIPVDFRLICATNEDPVDLIKAGKFREDLYHRVATVEITIPPLRERKEDLPMLIIGLLRQISQKEKKPLAGISHELFTRLCEYSYPGNIRELINLLSSMLALAHPGELLDMHLAPGKLLSSVSLTSGEMDSGQGGLHEKLDEVSMKMILRALDRASWNVTAAAKDLRITPFGLRKMMKRLGIARPDQS